EELQALEIEVQSELEVAAERALSTGAPSSALDAKRPLPARLTDISSDPQAPNGESRLTMAEGIREVLRYRLGTDERVQLFGQDIEDPKGDVFGVTRGLTEAFPGRVLNSPLSESTIVGMSIGQALAGARPVAFIQFADFLPLALNQILCELGT